MPVSVHPASPDGFDFSADCVQPPVPIDDLPRAGWRVTVLVLVLAVIMALILAGYPATHALAVVLAAGYIAGDVVTRVFYLTPVIPPLRRPLIG